MRFMALTCDLCVLSHPRCHITWYIFPVLMSKFYFITIAFCLVLWCFLQSCFKKHAAKIAYGNRLAISPGSIISEAPYLKTGWLIIFKSKCDGQPLLQYFPKGN